MTNPTSPKGPVKTPDIPAILDVAEAGINEVNTTMDGDEGRQTQPETPSAKTAQIEDLIAKAAEQLRVGMSDAVGTLVPELNRL